MGTWSSAAVCVFLFHVYTFCVTRFQVFSCIFLLLYYLLIHCCWLITFKKFSSQSKPLNFETVTKKLHKTCDSEVIACADGLNHHTLIIHANRYAQINHCNSRYIVCTSKLMCDCAGEF